MNDQLMSCGKRIALSLLIAVTACTETQTETAQEISTARVMSPTELAESVLAQLSGDVPIKGLQQSMEVLRDAGGITPFKLASSDEEIREASHAFLRQISGEDFGYDVDAWLEWINSVR